MTPNGWEKKKLKDVASIQTGIAKGKKNITDPVELPYLRVANVQDGYFDLSEIKTIKIPALQLERYKLESGDVLLTEGGDYDKLGRGAVWKSQVSPCLHQNHVFAVRADPKYLLSSFFSYQASSTYGKRYFLSCAKQTTNLASINSTQLKSFPVLLPKRDVQQKIVEILEAWDDAITTTEKLITAKQKLKSALVQKLMYGVRKELVSSWKQVRFGEVVAQYIDYRGKTPLKIGLSWGGGAIKALSANNVQVGYIDFSRECNSWFAQI